MLVLDDLHWADKATLLLLKYLVRYPRQARLMVIGTYRDTELDVDHPLLAIIAELGRERLLERLSLGRLDAAAVSQLVGVHAGARASPELCKLVCEETRGNALFVVEVLRHIAESSAIPDTDADPRPGIAPGRLSVPDTVKDVIARRVARLGHDANRLLVIASVFGREFELDVLQRTQRARRGRARRRAGRGGPRTLDRRGHRRRPLHVLSRLDPRRPVRWADCGAARRALLHRRAGVALEAAHSGELESYPTQLAHHFALGAARDGLNKAIDYGTRAAEHATSQLAYEQAVAHLRQVVTLRVDALFGTALGEAVGEAVRPLGAAASAGRLRNTGWLLRNVSVAAVDVVGPAAGPDLVVARPQTSIQTQAPCRPPSGRLWTGTG